MPQLFAPARTKTKPRPTQPKLPNSRRRSTISKRRPRMPTISRRRSTISKTSLRSLPTRRSPAAAATTATTKMKSAQKPRPH
ncbi:hypothetical protein TVAGG3_0347180 [Trichomonas vaginalis G3]|uniref:hypothetical protein n=1 Tax=Trichomonas vaginalis (strain ATCC PRA-98 / G3) TaxID=412133 RepID=UPI0021E5F010|nr:hypothetical protein TVAGG3_0347180 [Trichomonas vaginalis G3]KAI5531043.1 hypothetical protein TVAGG3_0347180 [Trichomonas vaginalis G3]